MNVKLLIVQGSKQTREIKLRSDDSIIGRRAGSDIRIPSSQVSRRHCRLLYRDQQLMVEDLGSANGTFLNGQRISQLVHVRSGDFLSVGPVTFQVMYQTANTTFQQDNEPYAPPPLPPQQQPMWVQPEPEPQAWEEPAAPMQEWEQEDIPLQAWEEPAASPPAEDDVMPMLDLLDEIEEDSKRQTENAIQDDDATLQDVDDDWQLPQGEDLRDLFSQMDDG